MHNVLGGTIDPHAAFLVTRGLKTLALRVRHVNDSALELAKRLEAHPKIARVHYPGGCRPLQGWPLQRLQRYARCLSAWLCILLAAVNDAEVLHIMWRTGLPSHPDHEIAKAQMDGFGGVISFEVPPSDKQPPQDCTLPPFYHTTTASHTACCARRCQSIGEPAHALHPVAPAGGRRHVAHGQAGGQRGAALHCALPGRLRVSDRAAHHRVLLGPGAWVSGRRETRVPLYSQEIYMHPIGFGHLHRATSASSRSEAAVRSATLAVMSGELTA